jgi:hypothetical protein
MCFIMNLVGRLISIPAAKRVMSQEQTNYQRVALQLHVSLGEQMQTKYDTIKVYIVYIVGIS